MRTELFFVLYTCSISLKPSRWLKETNLGHSVKTDDRESDRAKANDRVEFSQSAAGMSAHINFPHFYKVQRWCFYLSSHSVDYWPRSRRRHTHQPNRKNKNKNKDGHSVRPVEQKPSKIADIDGMRWFGRHCAVSVRGGVWPVQYLLADSFGRNSSRFE